VIDTTSTTSHELKQAMRERFGGSTDAGTTVSIMSFGFARGLPRNADLVFDMRFLRNPFWDEALRPKSGLDAPVAAYIRADPAYEDAVSRMEALLTVLLPRYIEEGKAYVTIAFGCTGGQHRSVHVAERVAAHLRDAGFAPGIAHRDLGRNVNDAVEDKSGQKGRKGSQRGSQ
jgi:RNase adapter protein RapZ